MPMMGSNFERRWRDALEVWNMVVHEPIDVGSFQVRDFTDVSYHLVYWFQYRHKLILL